jgi:hypothetical protein
VLDAAAHIHAIDPQNWRGLGADYYLDIAHGRIELARQELAAVVKRSPGAMPDDVVMLAWATRQPGVDEMAVQRLLAIKSDTYPLFYMAIRGEYQQALDWFEDEHLEPNVRMLLFDFLRSVPAGPLLAEPRTKELLRDYGFEAYWRDKGWPALCHPLGDDDFECAPAPAKAR